jgi:hypothetical protein
MAFPTTSSFTLFSPNLRNFRVHWNAHYFWTFCMIWAPKVLWEISYCSWKASYFSVHLDFGSLMREYHHFGALPYTFPSDRHEVVGHLIKCMARISPATTPRALAKLGWQLPMCPFVFSIQNE